MTEDFFSMNFDSLNDLIKKLDMFDEKQNAAVLSAMHKAGTMIEREQRRLISSKSKRLAGAIKQGKVYVTRRGAVGVTVGYQDDAFETYSDGFNPGIIGTMFEFGRPGQSDARRRSKSMKQVRKDKEGKEKEVTISKGKIDPEPHIRRGFDNVKEQAVQMVIDNVMKELKEIFGN